MYSLQQFMKGQYIEPTIGVIIFSYIKEKGREIFQDAPHITMEISSTAKSQDNIGWDNIMRVWMARHCN